MASRVALVTGGTRGIGLAIAEGVLRAGGHAVINGRSTTEEAERLVERYGAKRVAIELADVSVPSEAEALVHTAAERFGRLDMLVHSAGGPAPGKITDISPEGWMEA